MLSLVSLYHPLVFAVFGRFIVKSALMLHSVNIACEYLVLSCLSYMFCEDPDRVFAVS